MSAPWAIQSSGDQRRYPAGPGVTQPSDLGVLASVVGRQSADLALYADFVTATLADALPVENLTIVRKRGLFGARADAPVLSVSVRLGERTYTLSRARVGSPAAASVGHIVNGIVLSTKTLDLAQWSHQLAAALTTLTESNADAAAALARMSNFTI